MKPISWIAQFLDCLHGTNIMILFADKKQLFEVIVLMTVFFFKIIFDQLVSITTTEFYNKKQNKTKPIRSTKYIFFFLLKREIQHIVFLFFFWDRILEKKKPLIVLDF